MVLRKLNAQKHVDHDIYHIYIILFPQLNFQEEKTMQYHGVISQNLFSSTFHINTI